LSAHTESKPTRHFDELVNCWQASSTNSFGILQNMKTIIVGSSNPVKVAVVKEAFAKAFTGIPFTVVPFSVQSSVSNQPIGDEETKPGAFNRASDVQ